MFWKFQPSKTGNYLEEKVKINLKNGENIPYLEVTSNVSSLHYYKH